MDAAAAAEEEYTTQAPVKGFWDSSDDDDDDPNRDTRTTVTTVTSLRTSVRSAGTRDTGSIKVEMVVPS